MANIGGSRKGRKAVEDCFYGSVTVGERGQVVIPAEARGELGIKAGDKLLMMRHPVFQGLVVAKFESMRDYLDEFFRYAESLSKAEQGSGEKK